MQTGGEHFLTVIVDRRRLEATGARPLVFGRADIDAEVLGLDPSDMGISAVAGAVEFTWDVWWLHNRSAKRYLLIEDISGLPPRRLDCGARHAISSAKFTVLVPGAVFTHRLEVHPGEEYLARLRRVEAPTSTSTSVTITNDDICLSGRDREALAAVLAGFLRSFPRFDPHPATYGQAASTLGPPWDANRVRKQVERFRGRLTGLGIYIDGPRANYDLAEFLIGNRLLTAADLAVVDGARAAVVGG